MTRWLSGLTRRGWAFLALGSGVVVAAILVGQQDILRAGILLLILPLASLLIAARSRVHLNARRTVEPQRLPVGSRSTVRLELANQTRTPIGVVLVEDTLPYTLGSRPRFVLDNVWSRFRREVTYELQPATRGRFSIGPLTVRVTDPFGLIEFRRAFSDVATLIATPVVWPLPTVRLTGEWTGSGATRPRAIATAGEEDATVRAYRDGDDMRRVHWRATAHHGELMVRREEQPWQSRASILLDTRLSGHAGEGPDSSFEWAISAAASVGVHLAERGYLVRLVNEQSGAAGPAATDGQHSAREPVSSRVQLLDTLAVTSASRHVSVGHWSDLLDGPESATGMLIAVLGRLQPAEAHIVAQLRHSSTAALAILLDVNSWTSAPTPESERVREAEVAQILRRGGWNVIEARRSEPLATVWERLSLATTSSPSSPGSVNMEGVA
ncbi:DUF58 domain-containing protein [Actinobacteria bacterium YIM 96077]|uniref:DUF58 domain-containing protein n=1 Tax=Phytoactinopolyspora halophila TaxID=1981511 RepID=A0A329QW39_9ACTN|nr:DUF58 domain-containing protein [Phytoactinopolyspora halophila]AYY12836.1 DUF58 domain-containing protein [Actinobacteria bacterium YIM 96077]RAW16371.1 DUF58 domain-containing protein [Phytoactinopolyspora halophila]